MATKQPPPPRRYSDFLTPLLHKRFVTVAVWCAAICYAIAVFQGSWESLWSLFPFHRAALLFIAAILSLVPHVAQMHVGEHLAPSPFLGFLHSVCSWETLHAVGCYSISALCFSEAYLFARTRDDNLEIIDPGRPYEKPRLNERPIFLRSLLLMTGILHGFMHSVGNKSRLYIWTKKTDSDSGQPLRQHSALHVLQAEFAHLASRAGAASLTYAIAGTTLYLTLLRRHTWHLSIWAAKLVFTLPKANKMSRTPPYIGDLIGRFVLEGFLLLLLWEVTSLAFNIYLTRAPLKKGLPLSAQSKDPNGTLIQGLKLQREYTRTFAFWELNIIANGFPDRRELIYKDIDRVGGSAWSQLVTVCLGELHAVSKRIQDFQNPTAAAAPAQNQQNSLQYLPKIAAPIRSDANVFAKSPSSNTLEAHMASFAKAHGQSPGAIDPVSPALVSIFHSALDAVLSAETQKALSESFIGDQIRKYWLQFLRSQPLGHLFRHTFVRRVSAVVLGGPSGLSNVSTVADATLALAKLATSSLTEDRYGRVNKDVANIIRTYMLTIQAIENFVGTLPVHWTDVAFDKSKVLNANSTASNVFGSGEIEAGRKVKEVEDILAALKSSLASLLDTFSEYREELGLKLTEVRRAREVVGATLPINGRA